MKKLFVCLFALIIFSCSTGNDFVPNIVEFIPIERVIIPDHFVGNNEYQITLIYVMPSNCHVYSDIYYTQELNKRTYSILSNVHSNPSCEDIPSSEQEVTFNFRADNDGPYTFKFWQGKDIDSGEDLYLIVEVPVI